MATQKLLRIRWLFALSLVVITLIGLSALWLSFRLADAKPAAPSSVLAPA